MDGQEYLNQISAENRPTKKTKANKLLASKFVLVGGIGLIALIFIFILGSIISGGKGDIKTDCYNLLLHLNNTGEVIKTYQTEVKSSRLRADSASLSGVLSDTSTKLTGYLTEKYDYKDNKVDKNLVAQAKTEMDGLNSKLFEAKINGILDRIYAHEMTHEIELLLNEEGKILNGTSNEALTELVTTSYNSLENLYDKFNDFSETNN